MIIEHLRTNHIENPIGYLMDTISLSWTVTKALGKRSVSARVTVASDPEMKDILEDSGERSDISSLGYILSLKPEAGKRYYWQVEVTDDLGDAGISEVAFFEAACELKLASWIEAPFDKEVEPLFRKSFTLKEAPASARLVICGLGLYEAYINGNRVSDEFLAPYCNDYDLWIQYQTYDVTDLLKSGDNALGVMLGNGWYKGRFGFSGEDCLYGDRCRLIAELRATYADGTTEVTATDDSFLAAPSPVLSSGIYDGEVWDERKVISDWAAPGCDESCFTAAVLSDMDREKLTPRLSLPVRIKERIAPVSLIRTPAGEDVIDFGQEMVGFVEFECREPAGKEILFKFGEILQNGNFYNDNLRSAKQEFKYISDGTATKVRPHFTFYGFRYMLVEGITDIDLKDFSGAVLYSDMEATGHIETSDPKVNRLILNALWGQKGNFLDVPTDCPQRDERMGWTGDAQVFSQTASFNMYTPAFYRKYLHDMKLEQDAIGGSVPHVVPDIMGQCSRVRKKNPDRLETTPHAACAWSDAATVIPWTVYRTFGDKSLLAEEYGNMKSWVDYIRKVDVEKCGGSYLWTTGFHYADWLALDTYKQGSCFGGTDPYLVASAYYYYSATLTAKAAGVLCKKEDEKYYTELASNIKKAFIAEYFTQTGRLAADTQTALCLVLWLDLIPEGARKRQIDTLSAKLADEKDHLTTGFVGTPILCPVLTENGLKDKAYTLLFNEDYPSWLYEVNMGATTVWERWNSVLPNGMISDTGMNSLNHYAYGAIVEWIYRYVCGLNACEDRPGFERFIIKPYTDERFKRVSMTYDSAKGMIASSWERNGKRTSFTVTVPFDTEAEFVLTEDASAVTFDGKEFGGMKAGCSVILDPGTHVITAE